MRFFNPVSTFEECVSNVPLYPVPKLPYKDTQVTVVLVETGCALDNFPEI